MLSNLCKTVFLSNFGISSVPSLQRRNKKAYRLPSGASGTPPPTNPPAGPKSLPTAWGGGRAQRWPEGLCAFAAARSLTGKLRAGHARPLPRGGRFTLQQWQCSAGEQCSPLQDKIQHRHIIQKKHRLPFRASGVFLSSYLTNQTSSMIAISAASPRRGPVL